jgi:hypothetical protein
MEIVGGSRGKWYVIGLLIVVVGVIVVLALAEYGPRCAKAELPGGGKVDNCNPPAKVGTNSSIATNIINSRSSVSNSKGLANLTTSQPSLMKNEYLVDNWNVTGSSNGLPIHAHAVFRNDSIYAMSGIVLISGKSVPSMNYGKYIFSRENYKLSFVNSTGYKNSYDLTNIRLNSFSAVTSNGLEHYDYKRIMS